MVHEGMRNVAAGANPMALKKGIEAGVASAVAAIEGMAVSVTESKEQIAQVAAISAADREIGDHISEAIEKVGKDGVITIEEADLRFGNGSRRACASTRDTFLPIS